MKSRPRSRCGATLEIQSTVFHCEKYAGHKKLHEEGGSVDGNYRQYTMRWRGDSRETCDTCRSRTEHVVECMKCGSMICLNCRDPKGAEEFRNACIECPPDEEEHDD